MDAPKVKRRPYWYLGGNKRPPCLAGLIPKTVSSFQKRFAIRNLPIRFLIREYPEEGKSPSIL